MIAKNIQFISCWLGIVCLFFFSTSACNKKQEDSQSVNKGIGPIQSVTLGAIDSAKVARGKEIFASKCTSCHKLDEKYVGPALGDIIHRRSPEWIMNMILNPEQMVQEDPDAQELYSNYLTPMVSQDLSQADARDVLEYFRAAGE